MKATTYRALFLFAGLGGGALGFQRAAAAFRGTVGRFEVAGAVDFDAAAARDFERLTGRPCTVGDLSTMTTAELRAVCGDVAPDVLFTSPPCKSFSGCLPSSTAATPKYVEMSDLAVRGLFLTLEAFPEKRPRLILLENVPRIQTRGRHLLDVIVGMLRSYGYACRETVHDCGQLGGLAQRRRRFLLVARHVDSTGDWWREPPKKRVRGVGEVLGALPVPLPGSTAGGPMHRLPRLSALNWLRLALIPAGGDWRDLPAEVQLSPRDGRLNGGFGVEDWQASGHAVVAEGTVRNTWGSVADPRPGYESRRGANGVTAWDDAGRTVIGHDDRGLKGAAVADPRLSEAAGRHGTKLQVGAWAVPSATVLAAGARDSGTGAPSIADPRLGCEPRNSVMGVAEWTRPSDTVIGHLDTNAGRAAVADPRVPSERNEGGHGVLAWDRPAPTVIGHATLHNWPASVADLRGAGYHVGRVVETPAGLAVEGVEVDLEDARPMERPPIILALDGTWHRPMTTLELAALQSLPVEVDGGPLVLDGRNHGSWRERIGNAVPVATAEAIGGAALSCLLSSDAGAVSLGETPVWVGPEWTGGEVCA